MKAKNIFAIMTMAAVVGTTAMVACSKKSGDPVPNPFVPNADGTLPVTVAVENGTTYSSQIDSVKIGGWVDNKGDVYLTTVPYVSGGFSFTLPATVAAANLSPYFDDNDLDDMEGLTISNKNVKAFAVDFLHAYKNGNPNYVGYFEYEGESGDLDEKAGTGTFMKEIEAEFVYVDADCNISGSAKVDFSELEGGTLNASVSLKKGWNVLYEIVEYKNIKWQAGGDPTFDFVMTSTTAPQSGVKWTYTPNSNFESGKISRGLGVKLNQLTTAK
jgi:hypothetical protein